MDIQENPVECSLIDDIDTKEVLLDGVKTRGISNNNKHPGETTATGFEWHEPVFEGNRKQRREQAAKYAKASGS